MSLGTVIKKNREQKGLLQKQVEADLGIGHINYNKLESDNLEPSVTELKQLAKLFNMSVDDIPNYDVDILVDITLEDKSSFEQINLINQLDENDKQTVFKTGDTMLVKKNFKDFFNKNKAVL